MDFRWIFSIKLTLKISYIIKDKIAQKIVFFIIKTHIQS